MISQKLASITIATVVIATLVAVLGHQNYVVAEENETQYQTANNVAIHTVFSFRQGVQESDGFHVFNQVQGFDRARGSAEFQLQGVMNTDRMYLYEAADMTFYRGLQDQNHDYTDFDVDVYLHKEGTTIRQFHYVDCRVSNYVVQTDFDNEEAWIGDKPFSYVDKFTFQCNGYQPINSLVDLVKTNGYTAEKTMSSNDLTDTSSWSPSFRK